MTDSSGVVDGINPDHGYIDGGSIVPRPNTAGGLHSFLPARRLETR